MALGEFVISFEEDGVRKYAGPFSTIASARKAYEDYNAKYSRVWINRIMYSPYNPLFV